MSGRQVGERTLLLVAGAAFIAGVALASCAFGLFSHAARADVAPKPNASVYSRRANTIEPQKLGLAVPLITLPPVREDEISEALGTLGFAGDRAAAWKFQLSSGKRRLLWLTLWDWDPQGEIGDTVRVTSGSFSRSVTLFSHRQRLAVPEPSSGYIEITGEKTDDGIIAVSLLSGNEPIAVPRMRLGESVRIEIDQPR